MEIYYNDGISYWKGDLINELELDQVFVFGSNPEGRHGAGAAKQAMKWGAVYGNGRGLQSRTYALVTKNLKLNYHEKSTGIIYKKMGTRSVTLEMIRDNISELIQCCLGNPNRQFLVPYKIGDENLNGYSDHEMANLFIENDPLPENLVLHESVVKYKLIKVLFEPYIDSECVMNIEDYQKIKNETFKILYTNCY